MKKAPRPWASATDETKAHFALEALRERGPVVAFTAWVSADIDAKARATGAPLPWLRNRLRKALHAALGAVEWLAAIEEEKAKDGKLLLHMHGAGAFGELTRSRRSALRTAIRRALGAWEGAAARYQVKLKIVRDAGWASYVTKRCWLAQPGIRARFACDRPGSPWRLSFNGPVLTMTNGIRAEAQELHQKAREIVQDARQRAATLAVPETVPVLPEPPCEPAGIPEPASGANAADRAEPARAEIHTGLAFTVPALSALDGLFRTPTTARSRGPPSRACRPSADPNPPFEIGLSDAMPVARDEASR